MSKPVTAEMVKQLRDRTGVSMGKCKEALDHSSGDMEKAIDYLRKAGIASAVKKEGREAKEGSIGIGESSKATALVELNSETDFVAQNETFKEFLRVVAAQAAETLPSNLEALLHQSFHKDAHTTVDQKRALIIQSLGENIQIRRLVFFRKSSDVSIGVYSHMSGKIVVVVELTGGSGQEALARDIAMHVAAEAPDYLRPEDVPADVKAREEDIARSQVVGKPANIVDKIVEGKIKAFYEQSCLIHQKYVRDNSLSIDALLQQESKRLHKNIGLRSFIRWKVGG